MARFGLASWLFILSGTNLGAAPAALEWTSAKVTLDEPCLDPVPAISFEASRDYRAENAFFLLAAATLAEKEDAAHIQKTIQDWGFNRSKLIGIVKNGAYGFLAETDDFILLTFRGTSSMEELMTDLQFLPIAFAAIGMNGNGHRGMKNQFNSNIGDVVKTLNAWNPSRTKPLIFAGHSLGGAMAMLHALYLQKQGFDVMSLYTTAQPRVGDKAFNEDVTVHLGDRFYRMDSKHDPIPRLPPTIGEADAFSKVFGGLHFIQQSFRDIVRKMAYAPTPGLLARVDRNRPEESLIQLEPSEGVEDVAYWEGLQRTVWGAANINQVIQRIMGRFDQHLPPAYMCAFLSAYRATH